MVYDNRPQKNTRDALMQISQRFFILFFLCVCSLAEALDLSLYLVTNRGTRTKEELFQIVLQAVEGGVTIVQLREKETSTEEMIEIGQDLHALLKPLNIPLIINDRVDVALAIQAEGVHLGQSDMSVADARALLGKEAIIGLSVETLEQAFDAFEMDVDYIAASPVLGSKTKQDCAPSWGLEGLKNLCALSPLPVVAIGGVKDNTIKQILDCGAAGVAVVSFIFNAPDPKAAAEILAHEINQVHVRN